MMGEDTAAKPAEKKLAAPLVAPPLPDLLKGADHELAPKKAIEPELIKPAPATPAFFLGQEDKPAVPVTPLQVDISAKVEEDAAKAKAEEEKKEPPTKHGGAWHRDL